MTASGAPRLFDGPTIAIGRVLSFDTCEDRGIFTEAFTTFDEMGANWFVRGNLAVDSSASRLYAASGEFTSCDLPVAHYHFRAGQVKWMSESYLVARPAVLYVRDVPILWLPFLFQDTKMGRSSGILIPQFGFNDIVRPTRGYNRQITNIGYYWAPNDYFDRTARFDWFSSRYIQYGASLRYHWLNRFIEGGIAASRQVESDGASSIRLQWDHNQRFNAATTLRLNLDYVSDSRVLSSNAIDPLLTTRQISSSANFIKRYAWGNISLGGNRRQNVSDGSGTMTFPALTITPSPISLGRDISWAPTFSATNDTRFKTPLPDLPIISGGTIDTMMATGSARSTNITFNTPLTVGRFTWQNRIAVRDQVQTQRTVVVDKIPDLSTPEPNDSITVSRITGGTFESSANIETGINLPQLFSGTWKMQPTIGVRNVLPGEGFLVRNERTNGQWIQQSKRLELSLAAAPAFFGFFNRGIGPFDRFRHTLSPSLRMEWSPEADVPEEFARAVDRDIKLGPAAAPRMALQIGAAYDIPAVALRFFNIFGPRQALSNPYTGVAAIFSSRLLNGNPVLIYEDGEQSRDFVSVHDVVRGLLLAGERPEAIGRVFNIGSGERITVRAIAETLGRVLGVDLPPQVTGRYRVGDIRHCFASIDRARELLGYNPQVTLEEGMQELVEWLEAQEKPEDSVGRHVADLAARGLTL